jgi:hypothetical protein
MLNVQLQMVDELYCLISLMVHLFYVVKVSTNFISQPINVEKLTEAILAIDVAFED